VIHQVFVQQVKVVDMVEDIFLQVLLHLKLQVDQVVQVVEVVDLHQEQLLEKQLEDQQLNQVNQVYQDHVDQEMLEHQDITMVEK
jgi:hypothetical protein